MSGSVALNPVELHEDEVEALLDTLRGGWLTMGPRTQELEKAFCEMTGAAHAIAASSGSNAVHLACMGIGLGPDDQVLVPALSHVSTAHGPLRCGSAAVLVDCESASSPGLDLGAIEASIGDRTAAVIVNHSFGHPLQLDRLAEICEQRQIPLIEACDGIGGRDSDDRALGRRGIAGCISFSSGTALGVGEGGILLTDDEALADRARMLRSHAMTSGSWDRHRGHAETYDVVDLGYNYRIDEPRARLALARLEHLEQRLSEARAISAAYGDALATIDGVEPVFGSELSDRAACTAYPVIFESREARNQGRRALTDAEVETEARPPLNLLSAYSAAPGADSCVNASEFAYRSLGLPISASLSAAQAETVVSILADSL